MNRSVSRFINTHGFTLIELLVAVSVLVIIGSAAYLVFDAALNLYQKSESRIVMGQKCRIGLDRIATDLTNMQAIQGDEALALISQDEPGETGDRDLISFVTLINTDPDPFLAQLNLATQVRDEEDAEPLLSDVQRVIYYIGPDPNQQEDEQDFESRGTMFSADEEGENPVFLRITTSALDPEIVVQPLLEAGTIPEEDEDGNPIHVDIATIIDQVTSFDLKYSDGEEWYESWEDTETIPKSIQILISVANENNNQRQSVKAMTQSTMVYLPMSANFSEQPAGGQGG